MVKLAWSLAALLTLCADVSAQTCLHGADESPAQKARRDAAILLATRINLAQTLLVPGGRYRQFDELTNLPPTPPGFDVQLHTDGTTYNFSIKDRLDPCKYAVFSDQDKDLYEAIVRKGAPVIVPLDSD